MACLERGRQFAGVERANQIAERLLGAVPDLRWRADGREVFYDGPSGVMAVPVSTESCFSVGPAVALPITDVVGGGNRFGLIDATSDGRQLLLVKPVVNASPRAPMNVVLNWTGDSRQ